MVLIHEFGHSLACKSVGGTSDTIVLWPLGGVSYVRPPERPGAMLWSIAAGPLVNVVLLPITIVPLVAMYGTAILHGATGSVGGDLLLDIATINLVLLIFNMLPLYPLDGGQILRSLLWFVFGRGTSLVIAAGIGLVCGIVGALAMLFLGQTWLTIMGAFMAMQSYAGLRGGLAMLRVESAPRRFEVRCPFCLKNPPIAPAWRCNCGAQFDTFETYGQCPRCHAQYPRTACPLCGQLAPFAMWQATMSSPVSPAAPQIEVSPVNPIGPL